MGFTPNGAMGTPAGGQFRSAGSQSRGKTTADSNAGSFKAVGHGESTVVLGSMAPVPGYSGPRYPKGSARGGDPMFGGAASSGVVQADAGSHTAAPAPAYSGPRYPKGSTHGGAPIPPGFAENPISDREIGSIMRGDSTGEGRGITPEDEALVADDLKGIMADPTLSDEHKAKFQDMSEQLSRFGTVHMALNGPVAVRFGRGSQYGGDKVPFKFASFYAKAEADAKNQAQRTSETLRPAVAATLQKLRNGEVAPERVSALRRFMTGR